MKLSIIVPVYKAEKYLHKCVDSLLAQTVEDFEIILVNDGSPDGSLAIMEEYAAAYPDKLRCLSTENGGQGRARNLGIEIARGDWLGFVDSDDWVEPDMYEKLLTAAEAEGADLAVCRILGLHDDGREELLPTWQEGRPLAAAGSASNKIFRRELVGEIRFPEGVWYEDFAFSAKLLMKSKKTVNVPQPLYLYRIGQPSTMNNQNARKNLDILTVMEDIRTAMDDGDRDGFEYLLLNHVLLEGVKRLAMQHSPDKLEVITSLRAYVRRQIPDLRACPSYRAESRNRRLIMWMNYVGLEDPALLLLKLKRAV